MNERDGLGLLDRRMREASAELRRAVEAAMSEGLSSDTYARSRSSAPPDLAPVISLDGSTPHGRRRRRWPWAAAAAVVVAVGVAGVIVFGRDDDEAPPTTTVAQPFLLPVEASFQAERQVVALPAERGKHLLAGAERGMPPRLYLARLRQRQAKRTHLLQCLIVGF